MHDLVKILYLDNFKTGGTYVTEFLNKCSTLKLRFFEGHKLYFDKKRPDCFYFTSVRDPFEIYKSRFRYGCDGRDGVFFRLYHAGHGDLYQPTDEAFHRWLEFVLDPVNAELLNDGFRLVAKFGIGLQSYLHLIFSIRHPSQRLFDISRPEEFEEIYEQDKIVSLVVKNETLSDQLYRLATETLPQYFDPEMVEIFFSRERRFNESKAATETELTFPDAIRRRILQGEEFLIRRFYPQYIPELEG
jgi:hypothetical protein